MMDILSNFHHIFAVFHGFSRINDAYKLRDGSCQECLILWILSTIKSWVYCVSFVQHQLACFLNFHPIFGDFLRHSRTLIDRIYFIYIYFLFKEMLSVTYVFTSWVHISVKWFSQCICLVLSNAGTYHCIAIHLKCLNFSLVLTHIPTVISVTLASS